jgi:hypothetical protein
MDSHVFHVKMVKFGTLLHFHVLVNKENSGMAILAKITAQIAAEFGLIPQITVNAIKDFTGLATNVFPVLPEEYGVPCQTNANALQEANGMDIHVQIFQCALMDKFGTLQLQFAHVQMTKFGLV